MSDHDVRAILGSSFRSGSPLAQRVLAEDIAACSDDDEDLNHGQIDNSKSGHFMYRRPSGVAYGASRPVFNNQTLDEPTLSPLERRQSRQAERNLLLDNHVLPPRRDSVNHSSVTSRIFSKVFNTPVAKTADGPSVPSETSPLLHEGSAGTSINSVDRVEAQWEEALATGRLKTTWQRETKTITAYSAPLIATFFLQYSINVVAILAVGRIGKIELGAVSCEYLEEILNCHTHLVHGPLTAIPSGQHDCSHYLPCAVSGFSDQS
jgi:multidrug resistance protein, MATE family